MILDETRYKTHNGGFLVIIKIFTTWKHYLEGYKHKILIFTNYNNLQRFIDTKNLSFRQVCWAQILLKYHILSKQSCWCLIMISLAECWKRYHFLSWKNQNSALPTVRVDNRSLFPLIPGPYLWNSYSVIGTLILKYYLKQVSI